LEVFPVKHTGFLFVIFVLAAGFGLTGCNTIEGAGEDVETAGETVEEAAEETGEEMSDAVDDDNGYD
jgi:predicted small secreted protein